MTLSQKQRAKRRWKTQRTARAASIRANQPEYRKTTVRYKTRFGIIVMKTHALFAGGNPAPGFYDITK